MGIRTNLQILYQARDQLIHWVLGTEQAVLERDQASQAPLWSRRTLELTDRVDHGVGNARRSDCRIHDTHVAQPVECRGAKMGDQRTGCGSDPELARHE